jgi:hypothetical protein
LIALTAKRKFCLKFALAGARPPPPPTAGV